MDDGAKVLAVVDKFRDSKAVCVLVSCVQLFVTPWTIACQAPLLMEFSKLKYWSGLSCPPLGDLHNPGITFVS